MSATLAQLYNQDVGSQGRLGISPDRLLEVEVTPQEASLSVLLSAIHRGAVDATDLAARGSQLQGCIITACVALADALGELERSDGAAESDRRARAARGQFRVVGA